MLKVLLIDDDPALRVTLARMLKSLQLEIIEAANGVVGVDLYRKHAPHLVITDIMMPEKDGIETVKEIRAIDPQARIIALSGGGGSRYPDPLTLAQTLGAAASFEKPVRRDVFLSTVSMLLEDRR